MNFKSKLDFKNWFNNFKKMAEKKKIVIWFSFDWVKKKQTKKLHSISIRKILLWHVYQRVKWATNWTIQRKRDEKLKTHFFAFFYFVFLIRVGNYVCKLKYLQIINIIFIFWNLKFKIKFSFLNWCQFWFISYIE